jgi:hypothetical protein
MDLEGDGYVLFEDTILMLVRIDRGKPQNSPSKLAEAGTLLTCIREIPSSNIGWHTDCYD